MIHRHAKFTTVALRQMGTDGANRVGVVLVDGATLDLTLTAGEYDAALRACATGKRLVLSVTVAEEDPAR